MKKIFKGLAVFAATAAIGTGVAFVAGCGEKTPAPEGGDDVAKVATYTIVTKSNADVKETIGFEGNWRPIEFAVRVAVDEDGEILAYVIDENGGASNGTANENWANNLPASFRDGTWFVGKTAADIETAFGGSIAYDGDKGNINAGIASNELFKSDEVVSNASQSTFICLQIAAFASANADDVIGGTAIADLTEYATVINLAASSVVVVDETDYVAPAPIVPEEKEKVATYTIVTKSNADVKETIGFEGNWRPIEFTVKVSVDKDGKILSYAIEVNGGASNGTANEAWANNLPAAFRDGTWFVGKTAADIETAFGGSIAYDGDKSNINAGIASNELFKSDEVVSNASQSTFICLQIAAFASANADDVIGGAALANLTEYADVIDLAASSVEVVDAE